MKKLEIIVEGDLLRHVEDLLERVKVTGYTVIPNVSGKGHHGVHESAHLFNEMHSQDLIMTVVPDEQVEPIIAGVRPLFDKHPGVVFISDVTVIRPRYFRE
ncbi:MAG: P-II family nitrogen regulator [Terriglobia bacterium]